MARNRYVCGCCGAEMDIKNTVASDLSGDWKECPPPPGREWKIPAGKKEMADGTVLYLDTYNNLHTREEFAEIFGVDPERAFQYMRSHIRKRSRRGDPKETAKT